MKTSGASRQTDDLPDGLAQPARRALANAGIVRLEQLTKLWEDEVKRLHGIGPNAFARLRRALKARGLSFAESRENRGGN